MSDNESGPDIRELAKHIAEVDRDAGINDLTYLPADGSRRDITDFEEKPKPQPKTESKRVKK